MSLPGTKRREFAAGNSRRAPKGIPASPRRLTEESIMPKSKLNADTADLVADVSRLSLALKSLLAWRDSVNENPDCFLDDLTESPDAVACILFNGPVWDDAVAAMRLVSDRSSSPIK
jgi:hypothetical protein